MEQLKVLKITVHVLDVSRVILMNVIFVMEKYTPQPCLHCLYAHNYVYMILFDFLLPQVSWKHAMYNCYTHSGQMFQKTLMVHTSAQFHLLFKNVSI